MLTIEFVPFSQIDDLSSEMRIRKILDIVKADKIALIEGRLRKQEEAELIKRTMEEIDSSFSGIEISVIYPEKSDATLIKRLRNNFVNLLVGDRQGFTVIGPASIIKEIRRDPNKIQLTAYESEKTSKRRK